MAIRRYPRAMHVRRRVGHLLAVVVSIAFLAGVAVVGWAWKTSLLPDSYDVTSYGHHRLRRRHGAGGGRSAAWPAPRRRGNQRGAPARAAGTPDVRFRLVAQRSDDPARLGPGGRGAHIRRRATRAGAPRAAGRPRRGDAREPRRRAGRHDPLARRRPPERRGRGRRRDTGRRPARARRTRTASAPSSRERSGTTATRARRRTSTVACSARS